MSKRTRVGLTVAAALLITSREGGAQRESPLGLSRPGSGADTAGFVRAASRVVRSPYVRTVGRSAGAALVGGVAGLAIDNIYCEQRLPDHKGELFDPCLLYAGYGTAVGWFGGAFVGSVTEAARSANKAGCPRRVAIARALGGALAGLAPGALIAAQRSGKYPPARSAILFASPVLSGVAATAAVARCHS